MRILGTKFAALFTVITLACGASAANAAVPPLSEITADRVLGNKDAKVTIIEFASLTCSHCATFHTASLPTIQRQAIETGRAKLIYRDFPLDGTALKAAALARCLPQERYFSFLKVLFERQSSWATSPKPEEALTKMAALAGLSAADAKTCMTDTKILDALAQKRLEAQKTYNIAATPTLIFNEGAETLNGAVKPEAVMEVIAKLDGKGLPNTEAQMSTAPKAEEAPVESHEGHNH